MNYKIEIQPIRNEQGFATCSICGEQLIGFWNEELLICDECEAYMDHPETIHPCKKCRHYAPTDYYTCSKRMEMAEELRDCEDFERPKPEQTSMFDIPAFTKPKKNKGRKNPPL